MRALEEVLVMLKDSADNTSGSSEKIDLTVEDPVPFEAKRLACLSRSTNALRGNGLRCGDQDKFALLQCFIRIRGVGEALVLIFHSYQAFFRISLPF
jgi:hypothetical protein